MIFLFYPRRKNRILTCQCNRGQNCRDIHTYARRGVILVISPLLLMLRNLWNVIKYFGRRYVFGIQRRDFDPTDRISLQDLGGIKSLSFSVPYIKAHKSIIFSFLHHSSESSEHSNIQTHTKHQIIHHTFKKISKILSRISKISSCFSSHKF